MLSGLIKCTIKFETSLWYFMYKRKKQNERLVYTKNFPGCLGQCTSSLPSQPLLQHPSIFYTQTLWKLTFSSSHVILLIFRNEKDIIIKSSFSFSALERAEKVHNLKTSRNRYSTGILFRLDFKVVEYKINTQNPCHFCDRKKVL